MVDSKLTWDDGSIKWIKKNLQDKKIDINYFTLFDKILPITLVSCNIKSDIVNGIMLVSIKD